MFLLKCKLPCGQWAWCWTVLWGWGASLLQVDERRNKCCSGQNWRNAGEFFRAHYVQGQGGATLSSLQAPGIMLLSAVLYDYCSDQDFLCIIGKLCFFLFLSNMKTGDPTSRTTTSAPGRTVWSWSGMRMASGMMSPATTICRSPARKARVRCWGKGGDSVNVAW